LFCGTQLKDVVCGTGDDFWVFCGTQLKDVRISRTADDLSMFRAT